jgi:L-histidine Nalpha-methyltransferase
MRVSAASRTESKVVSKISKAELLENRRAFQPIGDPVSITEFAEDVRRGLSRRGQKELFSKYLYDEVGSALFDTITVLPEYGLTRADSRLLRRHSDALVKRLKRPSLVVELGSGSGSKTRWILSAIAATQKVTYCPVDVSESALENCWRELRQLDSVEIVPIAQSYLDGLRHAVEFRPEGTSLLILFLGSTLGNFDPVKAEEFLADVRRHMLPGDVFYLSTDLQKEIPRLIAAYDDAIGVTAAFNLNLLARVNRELNANFDLSQFAHEARYDDGVHRIEMHLRSLANQSIAIGKDFTVKLRKGETIWTESSYKFRCEDIVTLARQTGFDCEIQWVDGEWPFAQSLLRAV